MYFSYLKGPPPPTPVQASQARWVGVRVHVILLGIVGYVLYDNCTVNISIPNKCKKRTRVFDYSVVTMYSRKKRRRLISKKKIVHSTWYSHSENIFILNEFNRDMHLCGESLTNICMCDVFVQHSF
jgi:hypothetical protein